jgi:hypothetical protein
MLDHIQDLIADLDNSIKDEIIFKSSNMLEKIENGLIKQKLTEFFLVGCQFFCVDLVALIAPILRPPWNLPCAPIPR